MPPACPNGCRIDPKLFVCPCCGRTLDEIMARLEVPEVDRQHTRSLLEERRTKAKNLLP